VSRREIHIPEGHTKGEEMTRTQYWLYGFIRALIEIFCRLYFRIEIHGRENIPRTGAFIIAPVHRSYLDTPVSGCMTTRRMRYMGAEKMWTNRALGWFLTAVGGFPVHRGTADREALKAGLTVLERGEPLVMFPEGTRQEGPVVHEMFDGPAYMAARAGVPIIPVGLGGTGAAMPKGSRFIRPVKMAIVIGEPMAPPPPKASGTVSRSAVRDLTEQLGDAIQVLYDEAQAICGAPNL
jgi:1-acyl-sn-glycerol-3-phosphate acyltransferase